MSEPHNRLPYLDNAKLGMIFLVVYGHLIEPLSTARESHPALPLYLLIYLFHVPMWAFLAGLTSRVATTLQSSARLFAVLIAFQVFYVLALPGLRRGYAAWILTPWWVLWFLLSLISWKLILPLALKTRWAIPLSLVIGLAAGATGHIGRPLSLSRTLVWLPLFLAGHLYGRQILEWARASALPAKVGSALALLLAGFLLWKWPFDFKLLFEADSYSALGLNPATGMAMRAGHMAAACILGFSVLCLIPNRRFRLTTFGSRTLAIFVTHPILILLADRGETRIRYLNSPAVLVACAAAIVLVSGSTPVYRLVAAISTLPERLYQSSAGRLALLRLNTALLPRRLRQRT